MALTEEEAKSKWCPYSRVTSPGDGTERVLLGAPSGDAFARFHGVTGACIASRCMAWRWYLPDGYAVYGDKPGGVQNGYCGISGRQ